MPILNSIGALSLEEGGDNGQNVTIISVGFRKIVPSYDGSVFMLLSDTDVSIYERDTGTGVYSKTITVSVTSGDADLNGAGNKFVCSSITQKGIGTVYAYENVSGTWTLKNTIVGPSVDVTNPVTNLPANYIGDNFGRSVSLSDTGSCAITSDVGFPTVTASDGQLSYYGDIFKYSSSTTLARIGASKLGTSQWPRNVLISNDGNYIKVADINGGVSSYSVTTLSSATIPSNIVFHALSSKINSSNRPFNSLIYSGDSNVSFEMNTTMTKLTITWGILKAPTTPSAFITLVQSDITYIKDVTTSALVATSSTNLINPTGPIYSLSGTLPIGLSFDTSKAGIFGVATSISPKTEYTITVTYPGNLIHGSLSASATFSLSVDYPELVLTSEVTGLSIPLSVNSDNYKVVSSTGGTCSYTYSISPALPSGLSINSNGSIIGNTLVSTNITTYTITVNDGNSSKSTQIDIETYHSFSVNTAGDYSLLTDDYQDAIPTVVVSGIVGSATYSISPALPSGLVFNTTDGTISGSTLLVQTATTYTVAVRDRISSLTSTFTIEVVESGIRGTALNITRYTDDWLSYHSGDSLSPMVYTPFASSTGTGVASYSAVGLPNGVAIDSTTGALSGQVQWQLYSGVHKVFVYVTYGSITIKKKSNFTVNARPYQVVVPNSTIYFNKKLNSEWLKIAICVGGGVVGFWSQTGFSGRSTVTIDTPLPDGMTFHTWVSSDGTDGLAMENNGYGNTVPYTGADFTRTFTFTSPNGSVISKTINFVGYSITVSATVNTPTLKYNNGATVAKFKPVSFTGMIGKSEYTVTGPADLVSDITTGELSGTINETKAVIGGTYSSLVRCFVNTGKADAIVFPTAPTPYYYIKYGPWSNPTIAAEKSATFIATVYKVEVTVLQPGIPLTYEYPNKAIAPIIPVSVAGGVAPYTYSISPALPSGLTMSSTGTISGTPTTGSVATTYTVTVTDSVGNTGTGNISLAIYYPGIELVVGNSSGSAYGVYKFELDKQLTIGLGATTKGGSGTGYTYTISPALPAGLSINSTTGAISGSSTTVAATKKYTITVTDSKSNTVTADITLSVDYQALSFVPSSIAALRVGTAVSATVMGFGSGGKFPYTYSISPALPSGLTFDGTNCSFSGTPTAASSATYTVTVKDSRNITATGNVTLTVYDVLTLITKASIPSLTIGTAWGPTTVVTSTGGSGGNRYSATGLPSGLTINTTTGTISGTATTIFNNSYVITVTDNSNISASTNITLSSAYPAFTVGPNYTQKNQNLVALTNFTFVNKAIVNTVSSIVKVTGGSNGALTYSIDPALPTGLTLNTSTGVITGTPTSTQASTTYTVTVNDSLANVTKTTNIDILIAVARSSNLNYSTNTNGGQRQTGISARPLDYIISGTTYSVSPALPTGLSLSNGGINGIPTKTQATTSYVITAVDAINKYDATFTITVYVPVSVTLPTLTYWYTGETSTITPTIVGSGTYNVNSLAYVNPSWITLNSTTGVVTGTPNTIGTYRLYITVEDILAVDATNIQTYTVAVVDRISAVSISVPTFLTVGEAYIWTVRVTGGKTPITYSISPALPAWLSLSNGVISGTPTVTSPNNTYTITATDGISSATTTFTTAIYNPLTISTTTGTVTATTATSFNNSVSTSGGALPYSYTVSPTLPAGLNISASTGAIAGSPTAAQAAKAYTITVTDANKTTATTTVTIAVITKLTLSYPAISQVYVGDQVIINPVPSGGTGYSYSISPALPAGATFNTLNGTMYLIPTAASASASFVITVTDSLMRTATATVTYSVSAVTLSYTQQNAKKGIAYTNTPTQSNGTWSTNKTYTVKPALPAGLSLNSSTGVISGTPTAIQSATTYTITRKGYNNVTAATATTTIAIT
jgi:hypothetical protein